MNKMQKRKKLFIVTVILVMLFSLSACGQKQPAQGETSGGSGTGKDETSSGKPSNDTESSADEPGNTAESSESGGNGSTQTADPDTEKYAAILDKYYEALKEQQGEGKLLEKGLSTLCTYCYEGNAMKNVGYALLDLTGDGEPELLIGAINGDAYVEKMVFDMYTIVDGTPVQLFVGRERNGYYICEEEAGIYLIENKASSGATQNVWHYFSIEKDRLNIVQGIVYDAASHPDAPWFMTYDTDWDTGNDTPVDENMANSIINSYEARYMMPEYTAFENYKR